MLSKDGLDFCFIDIRFRHFQLDRLCRLVVIPVITSVTLNPSMNLHFAIRMSIDVIENLDVRVLKDAEGNVRVIYAFVDRSTIVLTTDVRTLTELAQRIRVQ